MGKIVYLMGKSSSGKDTIYKELLAQAAGSLRTVVPYTTRPIRSGEQNGVEYFFVGEEEYQELLQKGKVIEHREYHTVYGLWRYFTADDGQIALERGNCLMIGTLESYEKMKAYFGEESLLPVLIEVDDGERLQRALDRERQQEAPKYEEMCRRFLADSEDFQEEKILHAGIRKRFYNEDLRQCLEEITRYIDENLR